MTDRDLTALSRTTASGAEFGVTAGGFVPKPVARLLSEKIALARELFGADVDLTSGSVLRTLLELQSVEDARVWSHLGLLYESSHVATARGEALSRLGAELGIPRPFHRATGAVTFTLAGDLPASMPQVRLWRGTRLRARGGVGVFLRDGAVVDADRTEAQAAVVAFEPGPAGDLDPTAEVAGDRPGLIDAVDPDDTAVAAEAELVASGVVTITHTAPLTGGTLAWSDEDYRDLLLSYPRNVWTPDALRVAVSLVPGVRQVIVKDLYGGLDINHAIFGNFAFAERLFTEQRSIANPYFVTVLVAGEEAAIWDGPGQLAERVRAAVDQVRPVGIAPAIEQADQVGVGYRGRIVVDGLPVTPDGPSPGAVAALVGRIEDRVRRYVGRLRIGEPVLFSEIMWSVMNEPGIVDVKDLRLVRYPPRLGRGHVGGNEQWVAEVVDPGADIRIGASEVPVLVASTTDLRVV
ncbi:hypothetical protein [Microbacterium sp. 10M-3C3]|jgi:hypothetical protein|uniref:hypothetical protein n=1 Tax=Microbacterium sp. 10M-3C3 TaxID=2483401 RepID=UPI000F631C5F|nr:hypothetical protein [Microbacterium sp. 10M-3C3]